MRYLDKSILKDLNLKMVLLAGPRQCGKTTFVKWILKNKITGEYFNWDQVKDRKRIISQSWKDDSHLVVFDEIHKKNHWKTFLKGIFDTKKESLKLLITGSARLELFQKAGDSMLGRYHFFRLHPFCLKEDPLNLPIKDRFSRLLTHGNFPEPYLLDKPDDIQRWRNQRWKLLLREDIRDLGNVKELDLIELMAELLKNIAGGMLSYANLAEDVETSPTNIKRWVSLLEKLYLIYLLPPYSRSIKRSISKTTKVYFMDSGDLSEQTLGVQIENLVALNLLKRIHYLEDAFGERVSLHYVRDKEGHEVDFLITQNRKPIALIEVKANDKKISPSLIYFQKKLGVPFAIQLHSDFQEKGFSRNGIKIVSIHEFFSSPLETRKFWE